MWPELLQRTVPNDGYREFIKCETAVARLIRDGTGN